MALTVDNAEAWLAERVEVSAVGVGCWRWVKATRRGYGVTWHEGRGLPAHRVVWLVLVGPIAAGLHLDHLCRNRTCCNPDHLEPVTNRENTRRGIAGALSKARAAAIMQCPSGHDLTDAYRRKNGHRICRECVALRNRRRYARAV